MPDTDVPPYCVFLGHRRVATGSRVEVARAAAALQDRPPGEALLVFDAEGRQVELDLRGGPDQAAARAGAPDAVPAPPAAPRGRGRPQLGVVAREVTLLPRHWEWLAAQPGGASVTLRRLVDEARRGAGGADALRAARERAYRFLVGIAGEQLASWPQDVREHAQAMAAGAFQDESQQR